MWAITAQPVYGSLYSDSTIIVIIVDLPTTAPGWPNVSVGVSGDKTRVDSPPFPCQSTQSEPKVTGEPTTSSGEKGLHGPLP